MVLLVCIKSVLITFFPARTINKTPLNVYFDISTQTLMLKSIYSFTKRHKLVHNGGFLKFEVLYCSQNTVKSIKIQ